MAGLIYVREVGGRVNPGGGVSLIARTDFWQRERGALMVLAGIFSSGGHSDWVVGRMGAGLR